MDRARPGAAAVGRRGSRALAGRLAKLEARLAPPPRIVVRYEGCDWDDPDCIQVDYDENDPNILVVTVTYTDMLSNLSERG